MGKFFYNLFLFSYASGIRLAVFWNNKARLWVKGRKKFPYVKQPQQNNQPTVWMHCASLGEFEQGRPLLEKIRVNYPSARIVLSFFSPSGFEVMKNYPGADCIFYLPMDSKANAQKLIEAIRPSLVLWVKYEFWFYYLSELKKRKIPLLMVSGIFRGNQPFFKPYGSIWKEMLGCFTHIFVQTEESKTLLEGIGFDENLTVNGDTRFDRVIEIAEKFFPVPLIEKFCGSSKVIVAGSTWDDDEAEWTHYVKKNPQIKFIIAPHEIDEENLKDVKKEFPGAIFYSELVEQKTGYWQSMTSKKQSLVSNEQETNNQLETGNILIIDNIGMLSRLYYYADIAYIGGGFNAGGIHNVLEAAVYGKPVIFGPVYEKFAEAVELTDCEAAIPIENALELEKVLTQLWLNETLLDAKGKAAKAYVYAKAGATEKIMGFIQAKRLLTN